MEASNGSRKRMRLSDPDLTIVCKKYNNNAGDVSSSSTSPEQDLSKSQKPAHETKSFQYHSVILAYHSGYFDSLLSSGMSESLSKEVVLEDVDPDVFAQAMSYLEHPAKAKTASARDLMGVATFYNRFDCPTGLELVAAGCELFLKDFDYEGVNRSRNPQPHELELILSIILFSQQANLSTLIEKSISFLQNRLWSPSPLEQGLFELEHLERLQGFIAAHPEVLEAGYYSSSTFSTFLLDRRQAAPLELVQYDHPDFPKRLLNHFEAMQRSKFPATSTGVTIQANFKIQTDGDESSCFAWDNVRHEYGDFTYTVGPQGPAFVLADASTSNHPDNSNHSTASSILDAKLEKFCSKHYASDEPLLKEVGKRFNEGDWMLTIKVWDDSSSGTNRRDGNEEGDYWIHKSVFPFSRNHHYEHLPPDGVGWIPIRSYGHQKISVRLEYKWKTKTNNKNSSTRNRQGSLSR